MVTHWIPWCLVEDNLGKFGIVMLELLFLYFFNGKKDNSENKVGTIHKALLILPKDSVWRDFFSMNSTAFVLVSWRGRML